MSGEIHVSIVTLITAITTAIIIIAVVKFIIETLIIIYSKYIYKCLYFSMYGPLRNIYLTYNMRERALRITFF